MMYTSATTAAAARAPSSTVGRRDDERPGRAGERRKHRTKAKATANSATTPPTTPVSVLASGSSLLISPGRTSGSTPGAPVGSLAATPLLRLGGDEMIRDLDPLLPEILDGAGVERRLGDLGGELRDIVGGPLEGRLLVLDPLRDRLHDLVHRVGR